LWNRCAPVAWLKKPTVETKSDFPTVLFNKGGNIFSMGKKITSDNVLKIEIK
jgi:hypothetical protein